MWLQCIFIESCIFDKYSDDVYKSDICYDYQTELYIDANAQKQIYTKYSNSNDKLKLQLSFMDVSSLDEKFCLLKQLGLGIYINIFLYIVINGYVRFVNLLIAMTQGHA